MAKREGLQTLRILVVTLAMFFVWVQSHAAVINAGNGLPHSKSAYTTLKGHMTAASNLRFWGGTSEYSNNVADVSAKIWVARAVGNITYGFSQHGEVSLSPVLYQDAHKEEGEQIPWDTFLHIKLGNYKVEKQPYWVGFDIGMRFPTGKKHNVIFEDYTAGKFEFGITGLLTYRYAATNLKNDVKVHANLGYWNHNDENTQLSEVMPKELGYVDKMSQSIRYAAGVEFPTNMFIYGIEVYGLAWLVRPPVGAASRENYLYMNVNGTYKPHHRISLFFNADLRLSEGTDTTVGFEPEFPGVPSFPGWRVNVGLKYLIMPTSDYGIAKTVLERQQKDKTNQLYTQLQQEIEKREKTKAELEKLKREKESRQQAAQNN